MPRYIDADKLGIGRANPTVFVNEEYAKGWNAVIDILEQATTISPDDVRGVGKWIEDAMRIKCSVCGTDFNDEVTCCSDCYRWPWNYCPNCGARMKGAEDGTTE